MPPEIQTQISSDYELPEAPPVSEELKVEDDPKAIRIAEIERRKAELRIKMEEASKARRAKKGFMTPERKKKLRLLLRRKAAEELKKEQERKAETRRWIIDDRCGDPEDLDWASKDDLVDICEDYFQRILDIESEKWDIEFEIRKKAFEISELSSKVNDLRGKFQKPVLKKISKFENKFAKLQRKAAEFNFRNQLKMVRRHEFTVKELEEIEKKRLRGENDDDKGEQTEEKKETPSEVDYIVSISDESVAETPADGKRPEGGLEGGTAEGDVDRGSPLEDKLRPEVEDSGAAEGDSGLEGEGSHEGKPLLEGELMQESDQLEGGQSLHEGEAQPSEHLEPTDHIEPQHTEEDLWQYLKEAVTSEHPATVEEFVQNLIGTLQHVPAEYLKPVIDANMKRATTPSTTDGEHLSSPLQDRWASAADDEEEIELEGEASFNEGIGITPSHDEETMIPDEPAVVKDMSSELLEGPQAAEDNPDTTDGYSAVEAAA